MAHVDDSLIQGLLEDADSVWPSNFEEIEEFFNRCSFSISVDVIRQLGVFQKKDEAHTFDELVKDLNIFKDAKYLFRQILRILVEENVLIEDNGTFTCKDSEPDVETPSELLVQAVRKFPDEGAPFQWLARAYDGIVGFIKGKLYAEEVMFPWNSFELVEEVYNTSDVYGFYSKFSGKAIKRIIAEKFNNEKITMVEVGAGTGNGTRNVFSQVDDKFERYVYTDVSKALVQRSRKKFKKTGLGFEWIDWRELDISKDPEEDLQGCADIVLAVNVLHATEDLVVGLTNAKKLLKEGGWLILSELSPPKDSIYRYMELTFGLLPSYTVYSDPELRTFSAVIRPEEWAEAFKKAGFTEIVPVPGDRLDGVDRGGIVIGIK